MTDIVYTNMCGVIRQFSLMIGCGLEGNRVTFCPRFIGYCMWKAYINNFKQDFIYFIYRNDRLIDRSIERARDQSPT